MLYMNDSKQKTDAPGEQGDLFGYQDLMPGSAEEHSPADMEMISGPETEGDAVVTPETLPLIQETLVPPQTVKQETPKKAPLIFSARAPIPTRGGVVPEEDNARRKRIIEQTAREIPPLTLDLIPADTAFGKMLVLARENAGYSVEDVTDITRISNNNILALESENFKRLPSSIYRMAYLRELCRLYKLPQETSDFILQLHAQFCDEDAPSRGAAAEMNRIPGDDRKETWIFTGVIAAIGLVIILAIWAVIIALVKHNGEKEAYQQQTANAPAVQPVAAPVNFDQKKLENLMPERVLDIRMLEMSNSGRTRE